MQEKTAVPAIVLRSPEFLGKIVLLAEAAKACGQFEVAARIMFMAGAGVCPIDSRAPELPEVTIAFLETYREMMTTAVKAMAENEHDLYVTMGKRPQALAVKQFGAAMAGLLMASRFRAPEVVEKNVPVPTPPVPTAQGSTGP